VPSVTEAPRIAMSGFDPTNRLPQENFTIGADAMRSASFIVLAAVAAWLLEGCGKDAPIAAAEAASAPAESLGTAHLGAPQRHSGWWEFAAVTTTGHSLGTQGLCVTPATEAKFSAFDQITQERLIGNRCSRADFKSGAGGWTFDVACDTGISADLGGGIVTSKGIIKGDISTRYEVEMTITQAGESNKGKVTAAWKGACPAGRKPGDLAVDGAVTLNVLND
jgi:hypothetical protein